MSIFGRGSGSSPLTRGAPLKSASTARLRWIIPAHAGSTRDRSYKVPQCRDHPRSRGEHSAIHAQNLPGSGSSPLTRGAHRKSELEAELRRIIPAHAGSTNEARTQKPRHWDHPRSRGEHARSRDRCGHQAGSSPLTRGAPHMWSNASSRGGIIPAHAGSTRCI